MIRAEFRRCGADWLDLSRAPGIDGLALYRGKVFVVDMKTPQSKAGRVTLTPTQAKLIQRGWPLVTPTSPAAVRRLLGVEKP